MDRPASHASSRSGPARAGSSGVWRCCSPPSKARAGSARSGRTRSCWRGSGPRRCRRPSPTCTSRSGSSGSSCRSATRSPLVGCRESRCTSVSSCPSAPCSWRYGSGSPMGATQLVPIGLAHRVRLEHDHLHDRLDRRGATFDARQAKRLFPLLTSAAIAGSFLGTLVAGPVAGIVSVESLVVVQAVLLVLAAGHARPASAATCASGAAGRSVRRWSPTCGSASTPCSGRR